MAIPDFHYNILTGVISKKALFISPSQSTILDKSTNAQQKYLQKQGWTLLSSAVVRYQLQFRLDKHH